MRIQAFVVAIALLATPGNASDIFKSGSFPNGCHGYSGTISSLSGVDTSNAEMRGTVTKEDIREYCERDSGGETIQYGGKLTIDECVSKYLNEVPDRSLVVRADCRRGTILGTDERGYMIERIQSRDPLEISWRNVLSRRSIGSSCGNDASTLTMQFQILCPRSVIPPRSR